MRTTCPNAISVFGGDTACGERGLSGRGKLRILIADDHDMVRRGVTAILISHTDWEICGEAIDGADAVEKAKDLRPDLVLLDISMPGVNGLKAASQIRQQLPGVKILMMSQEEAALVLPMALAAGANGCVAKDRLSGDLVTAIRTIGEKL